MSKLVVGIFVAMLLVACTTNSKTLVTHGTTGIQIDCSGLGSGWDMCYERADRECKAQGYKVITRTGDVVDDEGGFPFGWNPAGYLTRMIIVVCRS